MNFHRAGVMVLLYEQERILLQLRTKDAERYPGYWAGFGGRSMTHEAIEDAAIREIREELGITLDQSRLQLLGKMNVPVGPSVQTIYYFATELIYALSSLSLNEGDGFALFDSDSMESLRLTPETRMAAQRLFGGPSEGWLE